MPSVIDARIRHRLGSLVPLPAGPWSAHVPAIADPERRAYAEQIAALMDARKERLGEHAAEHGLSWAVNALGPVDGPDVRGMPDGRLLHLRDTYPVVTAWAPRYVGDELRQVRDIPIKSYGMRVAIATRGIILVTASHGASDR